MKKKLIIWISDMKKKRKMRTGRENTQIEKLKTASFWIGLVFLSFPLLSWFFDGCSDYFFEMIDNRYFFPFSLLFGVGCGLIMFTIFDQKWRKEESMVAVGIGILVWMYLIVNVFVGDWCGLNWCFLAIFSSAMIVVGIRNLLEE